MNSEVSGHGLFCIGVLLWHLPGSTKENIDKPQSQPVQGRDLNPRPPKYETNADLLNEHSVVFPVVCSWHLYLSPNVSVFYTPKIILFSPNIRL